MHHNLVWLQQHLMLPSQRRPFIWTVVKCNAYGHNLAAVLPALAAADGLAVLTLDDALFCRQLGWSKPLLCMRPVFSTNDLLSPELHSMHLVIDNPGQLAQIQRLSQPAQVNLWLRYAGSLNHAGFSETDFKPTLTALQHMQQQGLISWARPFMHPAQGEDEHAFAKEHARFRAQCTGNAAHECAFNSAALLVRPSLARQAQWVRSGILHYGVSPLPGQTGNALGLQPVMTLQAPIYSTNWVSSGEPIGYGSVYRAQRRLRIGLVRCGYADGYPRHIDASTPVLVHGRETTVLGTVAMDLMAIDLTDIPEAKTGELVTLWGPGLALERVAHHAGTIAADLCCGLTSQVRYVIQDRLSE